MFKVKIHPALGHSRRKQKYSAVLVEKSSAKDVDCTTAFFNAQPTTNQSSDIHQIKPQPPEGGKPKRRHAHHAGKKPNNFMTSY